MVRLGAREEGEPEASALTPEKLLAGENRASFRCVQRLDDQNKGASKKLIGFQISFSFSK